MIELFNDDRSDNFLQLLKIKNKTRGGNVVIVRSSWQYRDMQFIGMTMNVFTRAIVASNGMCHFKVEDFCYL